MERHARGHGKLRSKGGSDPLAGSLQFNEFGSERLARRLLTLNGYMEARSIDSELLCISRTKPSTTVQQHIFQDQKRLPTASGEFSWLLSGITLATKMIE